MSTKSTGGRIRHRRTRLSTEHVIAQESYGSLLTGELPEGGTQLLQFLAEPGPVAFPLRLLHALIVRPCLRS